MPAAVSRGCDFRSSPILIGSHRPKFRHQIQASRQLFNLPTLNIQTTHNVLHKVHTRLAAAAPARSNANNLDIITLPLRRLSSCGARSLDPRDGSWRDTQRACRAYKLLPRRNRYFRPELLEGWLGPRDDEGRGLSALVVGLFGRDEEGFGRGWPR